MATLISKLINVKYLAGFSGSNGFLILGEKNYFFTDFRYKGIAIELEKSKNRIQFEFIEIDENLTKILKKILKNCKDLQFEDSDLTVKDLEIWQKKLNWLKFVPIKKSIEVLRTIKDEEEIAKLKKSQQINEKTLECIKKVLKVGTAELEIAWKIKEIGHDFKAQDISFEPIVAFAKHSAIPHHQNTNKKLKKGDVLLIDMGMKYMDYCSDMTRTFFTNKPSLEESNIYSKVFESQKASILKIKAGVKCAQIDKIARNSMGKNYEKYFKHSLGHGIGLDVHEIPSLSSKSKDILKENMIVTVEPGIYLQGKFGVRIEDMGRVTKTGYENFTCSPKELQNVILKLR